MSGYDSSDDKSPQAMMMLVLATFSTSYNLPVYLRYNITYRRSFLRMWRCQTGDSGVGGYDASTLPVSTVYPQTNGANRRARTTAGDDGKAADDEQNVRRQVTSGCDNDLQPSTSQQAPSRRRHVAVAWAPHPNIEQLDANDHTSVTVHRY